MFSFLWLSNIPLYICTYVPQLLYPFACQWISRLLPCPSYCKQCCSECWGQSYPTLCNPMECSMLGFLVHHSFWGLLKLMYIELVMPSNYFILCHPLLLLPSIFPSIMVFSNKSVLRIRWPKYWTFRFIISPSNEYSGLISFSMDWLDLLAVQGLSRVFSNTTVQKHQFFSA